MKTPALKNFSVFFAVFILTPNIIVYFLSLYIDSPRILLYLDYSLACIPAILLKNRFSYFLSAIISLMIFFADIGLTVLAKFNFNTEKIITFLSADIAKFSFIKNLIYNFTSNDNFVAWLILLLLLFSILYLIFLPKLANTAFCPKLIHILIIYIAFLTPIYFYHNTAEYKLADILINPFFIDKSKISYDGMYSKNFKKGPPQQSASDILFKKIKSHSLNHEKIFLIVVESFGELKNKKAQQLIYSALDSNELKAHYNVKISDIAFKGDTVQAEFRELCQLYMSEDIIPAQEDFRTQLAECLPYKLKDSGYEILMMHNSGGEIYDRKKWYDLLGADKTIFARDMTEQYKLKPICGTSYKGICEKDIFETVLPDLFGNNKKQFLHFMTVEGHMPISKKRPVSNEFETACKASKFFSLKKNLSLCKYSDVHYSLIKNIRDFAIRIKDKNAIFVIVGDHQTPMLGKYKDSYKENTVPYIIIEKK